MEEIRRKAQQSFLEQCGWADAELAFLAGDASFRKYSRLTRGQETAILMDAPPPHEDVRPFLSVARYLTERGFSAPRILAEDVPHGFLLLEDLGDDLFSRYLRRHPGQERELYLEAVETLNRLQTGEPHAGLAAYDEAALLREVSLLPEWFLPHALPHAEAETARQRYLAIWRELLPLIAASEVTVLRDYHADNLLWLPERESGERAGLLDFQDALCGHRAYDLVSMLEDARRDVSPATVAACLDAFTGGMNTGDREQFERDYALLAAQRNCKIIGIFHRLNVRDNKPAYLAFLPRVWGHLRHDVEHPALSSLKAWLADYMPQEEQPGSVMEA